MIKNEIIYFEEELNFLIKCYQNRCPQSWLISGPKGCGKKKLIYDFIKKIYKSKNFIQNVFEINDDENPSLIEEIRNLINQTLLTNSNNSKFKSFVIINNLELLNFNSSNALLKIIEEPPSNTIIFLLCNSLKLVPKTLQSRCIKIKLNVLDSPVFQKIKNNLENDYDYKISHSNPELFEFLKSEDGERLKNEINNLLGKKDFNYLEFEKIFSKNSKDLSIIFSLIVNMLFYFLKKNFSLQPLDKKKKILLFLNFLKNNFNKNLPLDKKRSLYLVFYEFYNLKLSL